MLLVPIVGCRQKQEQQRVLIPLPVVVAAPPELGSPLQEFQRRLTQQPVVVGDYKVELQPVIADSDVAAKKIATGELKSHAWISASDHLPRFVNAHLRNLGPRQNPCVDLFSSQLVVAARREDSKLLDLDGTGVSLSWILDQASPNRDRKGLSDGEPARGGKDRRPPISISHPDSRYSASGLVALEALARTVSTNGSLAPQTLTDPAFIAALRSVESLFSSYAKPLALIKKLDFSNSQRMRLALVSRQELFAFQKENPNRDILGLPLTDVPAELRYQLCTSEADWVTPAHRAAIAVIQKELLSTQFQYQMQQTGFDPIVVSKKSVQDDSTQGAPPVDLLGFALEQWEKVARPAALLIALDASGSMDGSALYESKRSIRNLLVSATPFSMRGLLIFSVSSKLVGMPSESASNLVAALDRAEANGGTAVYDSMKSALDTLNRANLHGARKQLLVITNGDDINSLTSPEGWIPALKDKAPTEDIAVVVIALNHIGADFTQLKAIATAAQGGFIQGEVAGMDQLILSALDMM